MAYAILFFFLGAVLGGVLLLAFECLLTPFSLYYWFCCRRSRREPKPNKTCDPDGERSLPFTCNKEGTVWVLEQQAKVPQICTKESLAKGMMNKKEIIKVHPIEKHAKIKDCALILSDVDGSQVSVIKLLDCIVTAVSASNQSSQKWAKRYPIKLESKSSFIYNGSKICYVYLNTSRDKESWCKSLRLASCPDEERINSYAQLSDDFQYYLAFIPFPKPFAMFGEAIEKANRVHRSKRIHHLLKKFVKMTSVPSFVHEKRKASDKLLDSKDTSLLNGVVVKASSSEKSSSGSLQDQVQPFTPAQNSGSKILLPDISNSACNEKFNPDDATLCWNLLFSRLFFDIRKYSKVNSFIKSQIQSALSDMRTPSYIGRMKCTALDLGNRPPYIHQIRVLSMDISAIWAVEVDIEYSGGMMFEIETKYEVQEPKPQDTKDMTLHPSSGTDMIRYASEDGLSQSKRIGWASTCMPKWKAINHSIADHVSHVPLSFTMRIASIRGMLQLHIKPPPSDQLWFGFTAMPEIDWNLESANGDQKISSGEIFLLLNDCFKDAIREFLVVPNFECICVPWMFDEKDDWVPLMVAPFERVDGEVGTDTGDPDASTSQSEENEIKQVDTDGNKANSSAHQSPSHEFLPDFEASEIMSPPASVSSDQYQLSHTDILEEETPESKATQESYDVASPITSSGEMVSLEGRKTVPFEEEVAQKPRKLSRKSWKEMGKMVGDKIEEQRRHIGEKGRHIVGKMRETTRT